MAGVETVTPGVCTALILREGSLAGRRQPRERGQRRWGRPLREHLAGWDGGPGGRGPVRPWLHKEGAGRSHQGLKHHDASGTRRRAKKKGAPPEHGDLPVRLAQKDELEARGARGVKSGAPGVRTPTVLETVLPRARQAPPVNIGERPLSSQQERGQGRTVKRPGELCSRRPDSREASRN